MSCTLKPAIQSDDTGQQMPFLTECQLTITWISITNETYSKVQLWNKNI